MEVVAWKVPSLDDLAEVDAWLVAHTKSAIRVVNRASRDLPPAGHYNVADEPTIVDNTIPQPIAAGTTLAFLFDDPKEAVLFKMTWG